MKKLAFMAFLLTIMPSFINATNAIIKLENSLLAYPGKYNFILDVKGKLIDKMWTITVKDGKATIKTPKGIPGKNITLKNNVVTAKIGILKMKKANDLQVIAVEGPFTGQVASLGIRKATTTFTVGLGCGFSIGYKGNKKVKPGTSCNYEFSCAPSVPDGSYTLEFIRPAAKGKTFHFDVVNGLMTNLKGATEGKLVKGLLQIAAKQMCATRRAKMAGAIAGWVLGMIILTIVTAGAIYAALPAGATAAGAGAAATAITGVATPFTVATGAAGTGTAVATTFGGVAASTGAVVAGGTLAAPTALLSITVGGAGAAAGAGTAAGAGAAAGITAGTAAAIGGAVTAAGLDVGSVVLASAAGAGTPKKAGIGVLVGIREATAQLSCDKMKAPFWYPQKEDVTQLIK